MKARSFFYKTSTLIEEGILTLFNDNFTSDLSECQVKLDRRLFDFLIGLDTEMSGMWYISFLCSFFDIDTTILLIFDAP